MVMHVTAPKNLLLLAVWYMLASLLPGCTVSREMGPGRQLGSYDYCLVSQREAQQYFHDATLEEHELEIDGRPEELVSLHALLPHVKGEEHPSAWPQHAAKLAECDDELRRLEVNDGVERRETCERFVGQVEALLIATLTRPFCAA